MARSVACKGRCRKRARSPSSPPHGNVTTEEPAPTPEPEAPTEPEAEEVYDPTQDEEVEGEAVEPPTTGEKTYVPSVESYVLAEEAKQGERKRMKRKEIEKGNTVVLDRAGDETGPVTGTINMVNADGTFVVEDEGGATYEVKPEDLDGGTVSVYSQTEGEGRVRREAEPAKPDKRTPQKKLTDLRDTFGERTPTVGQAGDDQQAFESEFTRLIDRYEKNESDGVQTELVEQQIAKMRGAKQFQQLTRQERDVVDEFLDKRRQLQIEAKEQPKQLPAPAPLRSSDEIQKDMDAMDESMTPEELDPRFNALAEESNEAMTRELKEFKGVVEAESGLSPAEAKAAFDGLAMVENSSPQIVWRDLKKLTTNMSEKLNNVYSTLAFQKHGDDPKEIAKDAELVEKAKQFYRTMLAKAGHTSKMREAKEQPKQLPATEPKAPTLKKVADVTTTPRNKIPLEQSAELLARAQKAEADLEIAGTERGQRVFLEQDQHGGTPEVVGLQSPTAQWYKEATTGPGKLSKQRVEVAVDKIIADKGRDTGKDVQRIKELLLQDQEFASTEWAPRNDEDWDYLVKEVRAERKRMKKGVEQRATARKPAREDPMAVKHVKQLAEGMLPENVEVGVHPGSIPGLEGTGMERATGLFTQDETKGFIDVALNDFSDPVASVGHETLHALWREGYVTPSEWRVLTEEAVKQGWGAEAQD